MENVIEIKGLKKSFTGIEVLKGVTFSVQKGENLVVIGKSGEGKSVVVEGEGVMGRGIANESFDSSLW